MSRADQTSKRRRAKPQPRKAAAAADGAGIPRWLPIAAYAFVTIVLFREAIFTGAALMGTDTYFLSYFARDFYTDFVREVGRFPLWDPLLFGGLPFVEGMHGDIFYPPSLALFFLDARAMWTWKMALHVFLAGAFTYLWLRGLGLRRGPAFFGGLVFMTGADLVSLVYPGGDGKLFVSALAPLVFWLAERTVQSRRIGDFAFFALGIALVVFTSHMQLAYFCVWGVSLYFLFRLAQVWRAERRPGEAARMLGLYTVAGVLGVAAAAVQFLPPLEYLREWSHRADKTVEDESGYAFSTTYSLHAEEIASLVVPEFVGDNIQTEVGPRATYWGRNSFKINHEYAGLVPLLLAPVLFLRRREPRTWFFAALAVLSLLYALGANTPAFRLFYLIPGVSLLRAPSLTIFLYGLSVATLGAMGLERLLDWARTGTPEEHRAARRLFAILAAAFAVFALLASAGAVTAAWQSIFEVGPERVPALMANEPNIRMGFWISLLLTLSVLALWEGAARALLSARSVVLLMALIAFLDVYRVDRPFIRGTVFMSRGGDPALFTPDETLRFLQQRAEAGEVFRAFDLGPIATGVRTYPQNGFAVHGIEQVAGHHGNEIGRYVALVGGDSGANVAATELRLLDILNGAYLVSPQRYRMPDGYEEVFVGSRSVVYRNGNALPRAFLAGRVEVAPDDEALRRILEGTFDPRATVLLPEPLPTGIEVQPDPVGEVLWEERGANEFTLRYSSDRPALLVLTENYFPAWRAQVDGAEVTVLRANYTFRAVPVPAGEHTVHFAYRSDLLQASSIVSIVTLLLLAAAGVHGLLRRRREGAT
jgi:hypothetical protein